MGILLVAGVLLVPLASPDNATTPIAADQFMSPSSLHWLGTDQFGRDVFSRIVWGGRSTLLAASLATLIALTIGTIIGAGAAGLGARVDAVLMRSVDVLMSFPGILVAMLLVVAVGPGFWPVVSGTGLALAPGFSRIVRASLLSLREQPFVEAATMLGASRFYIIRKHLIPNIMVEITGYSSMIFAWSILSLAGLEFLGLAGPPDSLNWGRMLYEGRSYLNIAPWIALSAGTAIVLTTIIVIQITEAYYAGNSMERHVRFKRKMSPEDGDTFP